MNNRQNEMERDKSERNRTGNSEGWALSNDKKRISSEKIQEPEAINTKERFWKKVKRGYYEIAIDLNSYLGEVAEKLEKGITAWHRGKLR